VIHMGNALRAAVACAPVLILGGCSHVPYRDMRYDEVSDACRATLRAADPVHPKSDAELACWHSSYEATDLYDLLFAEFDDQGWIPPGRDGRELAELFDRFDQISKAHCDDVSVVVFVHGWHHNADPADSNVRDFRRLLTTFAETEQHSKLQSSGCEQRPRTVQGRHVIGIYIGWAGESIDLAGLRYLTVEDRKLTAEKVAQGSVRELFARLTLKREERRGNRDTRLGTRMISIGHSFGALILLESLQQAMIKDAIELDGFGFARREGDLVVLINQAVEATRYEALRQTALFHKYRDDQFPSLISVTSTGDPWTGRFFEAGRGLSTIFEKKASEAEQVANITTVGHNRRYLTHKLSVCSPKESAACEPTFCYRDNIEAPHPFKGFGSETHICELQLTQLAERADQNGPHWVVETDNEVIKGHDGWLLPNGHFEHFLQEMYARINTRHVER